MSELSKAEQYQKDYNWQFPLRSSLMFMWHGGKPLTTWAALARGWAGGVCHEMVQKMAEYNSNCLTYLAFHAGDPDCVVNPYKGCPTARQIANAGGWEVDAGEAARWLGFLAPGTLPSIYLGPSLFCGDDGATTNCPEFHRLFVPAVVQVLRPYSKFICTGPELPKTMTDAKREELARLVKEAIAADDARIMALTGEKPPRLPVVEHLQGDEVMRASPSVDAVFYQFKHHPKDGHNVSVAEIVLEFQEAQAKCPKPLLAQEMTLYCETLRAREQARALAALPGCLMIPGPV
jgi:hypothetical protein